MLLRMAPSYMRFGCFELFYCRGQAGPIRRLADYVIAHRYPEQIDHPNRYRELFRQATLRTAELTSQWQQVGFAHRVMNTDNMSILGLPLDYGPLCLLDEYTPHLHRHYLAVVRNKLGLRAEQAESVHYAAAPPPWSEGLEISCSASWLSSHHSRRRVGLIQTDDRI